MDHTHDEEIVNAPEVLQQPTPPPLDSQTAGLTDTHITNQPDIKRMDIDEDTTAPDMLSPMSAEGDKQEENDIQALRNTDICSPSMSYDFSNVRVCPASKYTFVQVQRLILIQADTFFAILLSPRRQQIPWHPTIRTPSLRGTSGY